ncbi:MAG: CocE/NonD family hydrolase, partial [Trebonia sp.]
MPAPLVVAPERPVVTRDDWITLSDGCRLFARTVLPEDALTNPVPAVLEYLPYRLTDGTAVRDATHHPYFAGHGYAGVRVDIRGTGNSDGILHDEYLPQEQHDACEAIAWLGEQPWCTGAVGMYGKSWGGFNALQVAALRPRGLRAVISAYFTDDRYADDVHYMGGCVLGHEALSWASYMLGVNALPPDPEVVGERWREMWHHRLRETPFFLEEWLRHQRRDEFWRQGSICEDFGALDAAVLLVGGWADGYTNAVDRALTGLTHAGVPCRAIVGPWSHGWPEVAEPGPRIGFLQECILWLDHWLKGASNR